ncbi:hypothetical protein ACFOZ7_13305 [Natribaculum luteum]|uniref:Uncharacterized protein n=1 Tax=Natribaculum luteum TaxID=1586232 RepID=A0ABD5P1E1_9EURY|nr:hypothetical protein [Natribaculum luteum]
MFGTSDQADDADFDSGPVLQWSGKGGATSGSRNQQRGTEGDSDDDRPEPDIPDYACYCETFDVGRLGAVDDFEASVADIEQYIEANCSHIQELAEDAKRRQQLL